MRAPVHDGGEIEAALERLAGQFDDAWRCIGEAKQWKQQGKGYARQRSIAWPAKSP